MFLLPTNALLYYTYKMLKYTVKTSHYKCVISVVKMHGATIKKKMLLTIYKLTWTDIPAGLNLQPKHIWAF